MMFDKKKPATIIMAKLRTSGPSVKSEESEMEDKDIAKDTAAEELLSAIESKDAQAVKEALTSMIELCQENYDESEEESSEEMD